MLSKLLKYEFRDTARTIPLFYLISLIFAGMVLSAKTLDIEWFRVTTSVLLLLMGIAVAIITFVVIVMRFYKNLYSSEGYLMFTLPVKPHMLLASKTIVAFFWMVVSYGVCIGAFLTSMYGFGVTTELSVVLDELKRYGLERVVYLFIPLIILATLFLLGEIFFAITMSNRPTFHSIGAAAPFLLFLATYTVLQIVEAIFTIFVPFSLEINIAGKIGASLTTQNMFGYLLESVRGTEPKSVIIGLGGYVFEVLMVCILFYVTSRNMKSKVSIK